MYVCLCVCVRRGCGIVTVCFTSKTRASAPATAPLRAVRISAITRSNSVVGLIDARGLTTSHSRHILMGISYRQGLARALPVPSKENKRRDIRALFQRWGPFCLCLTSLREKWKEGQPISLAPTAVPGVSAVKRRWSCVSAPQHSLFFYYTDFAFGSLVPGGFAVLTTGKWDPTTTGIVRAEGGGQSKNTERGENWETEEKWRGRLKEEKTKERQKCRRTWRVLMRWEQHKMRGK